MYSKKCDTCNNKFNTTIRHHTKCEKCRASKIPSFEKQCKKCRIIFTTPNKIHKLCDICCPPKGTTIFKKECKRCGITFKTIYTAFSYCDKCYVVETTKDYKKCTICTSTYLPMEIIKHPFKNDPDKKDKCQFCWGKQLINGKIIRKSEEIDEDIEILIEECDDGLKKILDSD